MRQTGEEERDTHTEKINKQTEKQQQTYRKKNYYRQTRNKQKIVLNQSDLRMTDTYQIRPHHFH